MATARRQVNRRKETIIEEPSYVRPDVEVARQQEKTGPSTMAKWIGGIGLLIVLLVLFWWKTNTWPIAAMVGLRPITRFELDQALYKQNGRTLLDSLVLQKLVENELSANRIKVSDEDVNKRIDVIKAGLGQGANLEQLLAQRGMTVEEFKKQLKLQIGIEKVVGSKVSVTAEEIEKYVKDNGAFLTASGEAEKKKEAEDQIRQQKLQTEIQKWLSDIKAKTRVWIPGESQSVSPTP